MNKYFKWAVYIVLFVVVPALVTLGVVGYTQSEDSVFAPAPTGEKYYFFQWDGEEWVRTWHEIFLTREQIPYQPDENHKGQCLVSESQLYGRPFKSEREVTRMICGEGISLTPTPPPDQYLFLRFEKTNDSWFFTRKVVLLDNFPEPSADACYLNLAAFLKHPDLSANDLATWLCEQN